MKAFAALFVLALPLLSFSAPQGEKVGDADVEKRDAIKEAFLYNWQKYKTYAAPPGSPPKDKLAPVSKSGRNDGVLAGFGGTIVDSLSTHLVMGLGDTEDYKAALEHIKTVDFTNTTQGLNTPGEVSIFELTIRYIGGMLSAYQLNGEKPEERFLVQQAQSLANALTVGWQGSNKIPFNEVNLQTKQPQNTSRDANLAEAGTLTLEWGMLSQYTGDSKYSNLATGSVDAILQSKPHFPSIWATRIWPQNNTASATYITVGGGCDSFIEYLLKAPTLWGQPDHRYAKVYQSMIESIQERLVVKTGARNLTFIADFNIGTNEIAYIHSHLAAFIGGNIALAGRLFSRDDWTTLGLELAESAYMTYKATALGLGPYGFGFFDAQGKASGWNYVNKARREFYNNHGFFVNNPDWVQRPEVVESIFYGWRITHNQMWRDFAWEAFLAMRKYCDTQGGWAGIVNVNDDSSAVYDQTETFLFAEVFKYLYLIFDDSSSYSLDQYVFTTEAHPFKRGSVGAPSSAEHSKRSHRRRGASDFGEVQRGYKYSRLNGAEGPVPDNCKVPSESSHPKPPSLFLSPPGVKRSQAIDSLCSQTNMPRNVAESWMHGMPRHVPVA